MDRIGLGLAVTLEVLGPLAIALVGSRTRVDLLCALAACAGVYVLILPGRSTDYAGLGCGLLAAACWAAYILLNRLLGTRLPGLQGPAAATSISALAYVPVATILVIHGRLYGTALLDALAAGLLSSVVPYAADLIALRRIPPRLFGMFMSVHPVLAVLAGMLILGQALRVHEWAGILVVITVNAAAVSAAARNRLPSQPRKAAPEHPATQPPAARAGTPLGADHVTSPRAQINGVVVASLSGPDR